MASSTAARANGATPATSRTPQANGKASGRARPPSPPPTLSARLVELLQEDDVGRFESALAAEQAGKVGKKGKSKGGLKEDAFAALQQRLLHYAAVCDAVACAAILLDDDQVGGVAVDCVDERGRTALHHAAGAHSQQCATLLLGKGANPTASSKAKKIPLEEALAHPKVALVWTPHMPASFLVELVQKKELIVVEALAKATPAEAVLRCAIEAAGRGELGQLLALLGSKPGMLDSVGRITEAGGQGTLVDLLLRKALATAPGGEKGGFAGGCVGQPLSREVALKCLEVVLLWNPRLGPADRKAALAPEHVPLIRAARAEDEAVVNLLLEGGADVNETDIEGNTALHWCLRTPKGHLDVRVVRRLLEHGASCVCPNKLGATPVHTAAGHGHSEALTMMLGQDPGAANVLAATKESPLHYAAKNNHLECVRLLLLLGANKNVVNVRRERPLDLAASIEMRMLLTTVDHNVLNNPWPETRPSSSGGTGDGWQTATHRKPFHAAPGTHIGVAAAKVMPAATGGEEARFWKTKLCQRYAKGACQKGDACSYAHGAKELRPWNEDAPRPSSTASAAAACNQAEHDRRKIFVGGLPPSAEKSDLWEFFEEEFGPVVDAMVAYFPSGAPRNFGFVTFRNEKHATAAVKLHFVPFLGKKVEIKRAQPYSSTAGKGQENGGAEGHSYEETAVADPTPTATAPVEANYSADFQAWHTSSHHPSSTGAGSDWALPLASLPTSADRAQPSPPASDWVQPVADDWLHSSTTSNGSRWGAFSQGLDAHSLFQNCEGFDVASHTAPAPAASRLHSSPPAFPEEPPDPGADAEDDLLSQLMATLLPDSHPLTVPDSAPAGTSRAAPPPSRHSHEGESLEGLCVVCWELPHTCVAVPCGHRCLCTSCKDALLQACSTGQDTGECPLCRRSVERWFIV